MIQIAVYTHPDVGSVIDGINVWLKEHPECEHVQIVPFTSVHFPGGINGESVPRNSMMILYKVPEPANKPKPTGNRKDFTPADLATRSSAPDGEAMQTSGGHDSVKTLVPKGDEQYD